MESTWYRDSDGDGRGAADVTTVACEPPEGYVPFGDDCDDASAARHPGAEELCDGLDDDCDGLVDEASASNAICNGCQLFDIGGRSYAMCSGGATWDAARSGCAAFSGDLLRIDDAAEQAAVVARAARGPRWRLVHRPERRRERGRVRMDRRPRTGLHRLEPGRAQRRQRQRGLRGDGPGQRRVERRAVRRDAGVPLREPGPLIPCARLHAL
jgi:hypothetical protein